MVHTHLGTFTVIDGLDGVGKGIVIDGIREALEKQGVRIFSLDQWSTVHHFLPEFEIKNLANRHAYYPLDSFDVLVSSEPTYGQIGDALREEVICTNERVYSAHFTAQLYAADRLILHRRVILPALAAGKHVLQSRSISTSLVYQSKQTLLDGERPLSMKEILELEGNRFCLENGPNLLIIPTLTNAQDVIARLSQREKMDHAIFENLAFQMGIKPLYEGEELRELFEEHGTIVRYIDAGISPEESKKQGIETYRRAFPSLFSEEKFKRT